MNSLLQDHSPIQDPGMAELCREMERRVQNGQCDLVDLLEPRPGQRERDLRSFKLTEPWGDRTYTGKYVGLFRLEGRQVVITSRFDQPEKPFFLYYLLEHLWDAALMAQEPEASFQKDPFDILLDAKLAIQLEQAWKKGALRQYRTFQLNDSRLRGPVDVPRHIRENMGLNNGRIAYSTRSYSLDNPCSVLFLQAVDLVDRKHPGLLRRLGKGHPALQSALSTLRQEAPGWAESQRQAVLRHTEKRLTNPIHRAYEPARVAARAILRRQGADPAGETRRGQVVTGVFLDMDELWERFLERELFDRPPEGVAQKSRRILKKHMKLRPDFYWPDKGVVLDAKNRDAWGETLGKGPKALWTEDEEDRDGLRDDIYQVFAYMLALNCREGGVVFPCHSGRKSGTKKKGDALHPVEVSGLCGDRSFWRIPVNIPRGETEYESFAWKLDEELRELKKVPVIQTVLN